MGLEAETLAEPTKIFVAGLVATYGAEEATRIVRTYTKRAGLMVEALDQELENLTAANSSCKLISLDAQRLARRSEDDFPEPFSVSESYPTA